jgi:hypothetical protein
MKTKKGELGDIVGLDETIFLILFLVFFVILLTFVYNAGSRAFVYEESYAKQIVSIIDNAKPGMNILLDVGKGLEVGKKNGIDVNNTFRVDDNENKIMVRLSSNGYSYKYFSDYDVKLSLQDNLLLISIGGKNLQNEK